jgi:hypothetical protein
MIGIHTSVAFFSSSPARRLLHRPVLVLIILAGSHSISGASGTPEDARAFVHAIVTSELAADANDHSRWMYRDEDKTPGKNTVKLVIQTSHGDLSKTI